MLSKSGSRKARSIFLRNDIFRIKRGQAIMFYDMDTCVENFPLLSQQTGAIEDDIIYVPNSKEIHVTKIQPAFIKKLKKSAELIRSDNPTFEIRYYFRIPCQVGPPCSSNFAQSPNQ